MYDIASQKQSLHRTQLRSANRFFWIAGLTLFSTATTMSSSGGGYMSATALGVVEFANRLLPDKSVALGFAIVMAAIFVAFGWFARSGNITVFIAGMSLYAVDALLMVVGQVWIAVAVHAFILYRIFTGFQSATKLQDLIRQEEAELRRQRIMSASSGQP